MRITTDYGHEHGNDITRCFTIRSVGARMNVLQHEHGGNRGGNNHDPDGRVCECVCVFTTHTVNISYKSLTAKSQYFWFV